MRPQPLPAGPVPSSPGDLLVVPVVEQVCRRGKQQELDGGRGLNHLGRGPHQVTGTLRFSPLEEAAVARFRLGPQGRPPDATQHRHRGHHTRRLQVQPPRLHPNCAESRVKRSLFHAHDVPSLEPGPSSG